MTTNKSAGKVATADDDAPNLRARILAAASLRLAERGVAALTTRSVAAGVQAPALYRLFGDKYGLLHAVAEHDLAAFTAKKRESAPDPDPVRDLARSWDQYVAFGLANPAVFAIVNELGAQRSPAAVTGLAVLRERIETIARAGQLGVSVARALELIHAAGIGTIAALLTVPANERDPLLAPAMRDAVMAAVLVEPAVRMDGGLSAIAVTLGTRMDEVEGLTPGERLLMSELLGLLASGARA